MRRSRLAAARAGHVRKRGQPCGRQRNVGSPRGPHLMVSTSMVYGCIIDVFNTEDISAECPRRSALRSCYDYVFGLCGRMKDVVVGAFVPFAVSRLCHETSRHFGDGWRFWLLLPSIPVLWGWLPFWSSSLFLMLNEKPRVFAGVHTRLINA